MRMGTNRKIRQLNECQWPVAVASVGALLQNLFSSIQTKLRKAQKGQLIPIKKVSRGCKMIIDSLKLIITWN